VRDFELTTTPTAGIVALGIEPHQGNLAAVQDVDDTTGAVDTDCGHRADLHLIGQIQELTRRGGRGEREDGQSQICHRQKSEIFYQI